MVMAWLLLALVAPGFPRGRPPSDVDICQCDGVPGMVGGAVIPGRRP
jgi:hypothetical protein